MITGVDVSKWNYGWNPSKATKPIGFVIQRSSYGVTKDEKFEELWEQSLKIPVRGFYHYYSSHINWKLQADFLLNLLAGKDYHFLAVDYERAFNTLDKRTIAELAEMVKYLKEKTGKKVLVYFNQDVYLTCVKYYGYENWAKEQDIWYAQYPYGEPVLPRLPYGLNKWTIWQWGGADVGGNEAATAGQYYGGGLQGIDLNWFDGTEADLRSFFGVSETIPTPEPEPIPEPIPEPAPKPIPIDVVTVTVLYLNVRSGAGTSYDKVGYKLMLQSSPIYEITIVDGNVWALGDTGWFALKYNNVYYTTWREKAAGNKIAWVLPRPLPYDGPAVVAGSDAPKQNHPHYPVDEKWQTWIRKLSDDREDCWAIFSADDVGPSKGINSQGKLIYIPATWSFNVVETTGKASNGWVEVKCINMARGIPAVTHESHPTLVGIMTTSTEDRDITYWEDKNGMKSAWNSVRDPLMSYADTMWLPSEFLTTSCVILWDGLRLREAPSIAGRIVGGFSAGSVVNIYEVRHENGNIWGNTGKGWIALKFGDKFYTNWRIV